jgi:hypothetical protein
MNRPSNLGTARRARSAARAGLRALTSRPGHSVCLTTRAHLVYNSEQIAMKLA